MAIHKRIYKRKERRVPFLFSVAIRDTEFITCDKNILLDKERQNLHSSPFIMNTGSETDMNTVYIDVLFLINFALDYMTLYLGGKLFRHRMSRPRLILTSVGMAFYALWALLWCRSYLLLLLSAMTVILLACTVAFRLRGWSRILKTAFMCSGIGAMLGAGVYLLWRVIEKAVPAKVGGNGGGIKVIVFTLLAAVSGILLYFANRLITDVRGIKSIEVNFNLADKACTAHMLVDSGNLVTDPLSGRKVLFISRAYALHRFGDRIDSLEYLPQRRRWLCVTTATGKQTLMAFLPQEIKVGDKAIEALIAIVDKSDFHGYDGIFPAALLP